MDPMTQNNLLQSRRAFLQNTGMGLGAAAFASLVPQSTMGGPTGVHFPAKAKRIIFLFMAGAPSQVDLFDRKPDLERLFNTELPKSVSQGQRVTAMTRGKQQLVAPSKFAFLR